MADRAILVCTDGSELSLAASAAGLAVVGPGAVPILVTVQRPIDWGAIHGTGHAGGIVDDVGYDRAMADLRAEGEETLAVAADRLGLHDAERCLVWGEPGPEICQLAADRDVDAIVIGTRGQGGLRRALLGSVSDFVVRNAPCPVVVSSPESA